MYKDIKGFPNYEIYNDGNVKMKATDHIKKRRIIRGYHYVDLNHKDKRKNLRLGRLVAQHFIPNPKKLPQVNHIDGNCLNDKVSNLEWVTVSENQLHKNNLRRKNGIYKVPKGRMKLERDVIDKVLVLRQQGSLHRQIAEKLNIGVSTVTHILLGTRRKYQ